MVTKEEDIMFMEVILMANTVIEANILEPIDILVVVIIDIKVDIESEIEVRILNLKESMEKDIIIVALQVKFEDVTKDIGHIRFIIVALLVDINILIHSYYEENFEIHIDFILYIRLFLQLDRIMEIVDILNWVLKYLIEIEIVIELMIQKNILELSLLLILDIYQI
ncbi:MAG: hypothetical protein EZS28_011907, partial [Streblomastix strix]